MVIALREKSLRTLGATVGIAVAGAITTAFAAEFPVVRLTEASYVAPPSVARNGTVCSAYDTSVCADVSQFYKSANRQLLRLGFVTAFSPSWGIRTQFTVGAHASKVSVNPRLILGLIGTTPLSGGGSISGEVSASVGGDVRHRPCVDEYDRLYYCGSLTSWEDFEGKRVRFSEYGVRLSYQF